MGRFLAAAIAGVAMLAISTGAQAQTTAADGPSVATPYVGPVAVIVSFPMRAGMTRKDVEALFAKYTPYYQSQEGLKQKYFTLDERTRRMGGIYLWADRATAERFYNDAWRKQVVTVFGAAPEVIWYDVPSVIRGKAGMP